MPPLLESRITHTLVAVFYEFDRHVTSTLGCYDFLPYSIWIIYSLKYTPLCAPFFTVEHPGRQA